MAWVRFLEARQVLRGDGTVKASFETDGAYDLPEPSARRWINRGVAVRCDAPPPKAKPAEPEPEPDDGTAVEAATDFDDDEAEAGEDDAAPFRIVERGHGWFDVIGPDGQPRNEKALRQEEADALFEELAGE